MSDKTIERIKRIEKMMTRTCKVLFGEDLVSFGFTWFLFFDLLFAILFLTIKMLIKSGGHSFLEFIHRNRLHDIRICA